jgi:hypothetical protein
MEKTINIANFDNVTVHRRDQNQKEAQIRVEKK